MCFTLCMHIHIYTTHVCHVLFSKCGRSLGMIHPSSPAIKSNLDRILLQKQTQRPLLRHQHLVFPLERTRTQGTRRNDDRQKRAQARHTDSRCSPVRTCAYVCVVVEREREMSKCHLKCGKKNLICLTCIYTQMGHIPPPPTALHQIASDHITSHHITPLRLPWTRTSKCTS